MDNRYRATIAVIINDSGTIYGRRYIDKRTYTVEEEPIGGSDDLKRLSKSVPVVYRGGQIAKQGEPAIVNKILKDIRVYSNKDGELRAWNNGSFIRSSDFLRNIEILLFDDKTSEKGEHAYRAMGIISNFVVFSESDEVKLGLICWAAKKSRYAQSNRKLAYILDRALDLLNPQIILPGISNDGVIIQRNENGLVSVKYGTVYKDCLFINVINELSNGNIMIDLNDHRDMNRRYGIEISSNGSRFISY